MRFTCCLNTAFNLTKPLWALIFLHEVTRKSIAVVTDHFVELLFSKTFYASMTLWRRYDVEKFDADAIFFSEIQCKKWDILLFNAQVTHSRTGRRISHGCTFVAIRIGP